MLYPLENARNFQTNNNNKFYFLTILINSFAWNFLPIEIKRHINYRQIVKLLDTAIKFILKLNQSIGMAR